MRITALLTTLCVTCCWARAGDGDWRSDVLLECERGMGGTAIGDLDPDAPGNEVAVVNGGGEAWLVRRTAAGWQPERIHKGSGEMIMCAIGDADPRTPGNEFVGVGMVEGEESTTGPGQVLLIRKQDGQWRSERVFEDNHMIHGVAIGDVSQAHAGCEIIACGFNHRVQLIYLYGDTWQHETIYVANDRLKIAHVADVLPEHDGAEVVVCGSDGNVVALWEGKLGWKHEVIFADPIGQSRITAAEPGVLIGGDGGKVTLATRQDATWTTEFLMRDSGKIRGVAIADVDPACPGVELYAGGYSRHVTQLTRDEHGFWTATVIFTAQRPLHHLVAGEFDPAHPGLELVTCGHEGRLIALYPE